MVGWKESAWRMAQISVGLAYTLLMKLLAWQARPGTTNDRSRTKAEGYSSISATNQH